MEKYSRKLSDVITQDFDCITKVDPLEKYAMVGVLSYAKGLFQREQVLGHGTSYKQFYRLNSDHLVVSQLFAWEGAIALSSNEFEGKYVSPMFPLFMVDEEKADRDFLFYYLNQSFLWRELYRIGKGMGSRRRTVTADQFLSLDFPEIGINEQRAISKEINLFVKKKSRILELKESLFDDTKNLLYSKYIDITKDCPTEKMNVVAPITRRPVELEMDREYKELASRSFGKGTFVKPRFKGIDLTWQKPYWVKGGDLLFSNIKAWEGSIALISPEEDDWVVSHRYITCVPNSEMINSQFLLYYLLSPQGMEQVNLAYPGTADRNRTLSLKKLETIEVPVPSLESQIEFQQILEKTEQMKARIEKTKQDLEELFPALLDKAFKGELI